MDIVQGKISKKLPVFYNPVMKLNRDISIILLNSVPQESLQIALPLAGSGVRGIRFLQELHPGKIRSLHMNDYKTGTAIRNNLKINSLSTEVSEMDANQFLLDSKGFDYIDIDPFGTPNPFLNSSVLRLSRTGILAVTATDTSALAGSSPTACQRKYWAKPLKNEFMHETGIRILIRKVQLVGAQFEKALTPIFSYFKDHYYRIFFKCEKGRQKVDRILKQHKYLGYDPKTSEIMIYDQPRVPVNQLYAGPLWAGLLWDHNLAEKMYEIHDKTNKKLSVLLSIIVEESKIESVGFYDLHKIAPNKKIDYFVKPGTSARTHFLGWGIRSIIFPLE